MQNDYIYDLLFAPVVVDGDTLDCFLDLGFDAAYQHSVRLSGLDAPETHTQNTKDPLELAAGNKTKIIVSLWTAAYFPAGLQLNSTVFDKYGRSLGILSCPKVPQSLNDYLIVNKLVRTYAGDAKKPWLPAELQAIIDFPLPVFVTPKKTKS